MQGRLRSHFCLRLWHSVHEMMMRLRLRSGCLVPVLALAAVVSGRVSLSPLDETDESGDGSSRAAICCCFFLGEVRAAESYNEMDSRLILGCEAVTVRYMRMKSTCWFEMADGGYEISNTNTGT